MGKSAMTLTGVHFILIILVLHLIQTKNFLVETEDLKKDGAKDYKEEELTKEDYATLIGLDFDGNGKITLEEFMDFFVDKDVCFNLMFCYYEWFKKNDKNGDE